MAFPAHPLPTSTLPAKSRRSPWADAAEINSAVTPSLSFPLHDGQVWAQLGAERLPAPAGPLLPLGGAGPARAAIRGEGSAS